MITIFALSPERIAQSEELRATLSERAQWTAIGKIEELAAHRQQPGVLLISALDSKQLATIGTIRSTAPNLAILVVIETDKYNASVAEDGAIDYLPVNAEPYELWARIYRAWTLSELRLTMEQSTQLDEVRELYSYPYFVKRLEEEMSLAKRHQTPMSCMIFDLSFYDIYMDSYGYRFISDMLAQIARKIKQTVRKEDILARLGDSEIGVMLPRSNEQGALSLCTRILRDIEAMKFYVGDQVERVYMAAGIASYPMPNQDNLDCDGLIRFTRHALHQARYLEENDPRVQVFSEIKPFV